MALSVSSNFAISAGYASNNMRNSQSLMGKSINRISSGNRAFKPSDDLHSYIAGTKLKGDSTAYAALATGVQDAAARLNSMDAGFDNANNILLEMKSLAQQYKQAASGSDEAVAIQKAGAALKTALAGPENIQYKGSSVYLGTSLNVYFGIGVSALSISSTIGAWASAIDNVAGVTAADAVTKIDAAIAAITTRRAALGGNISALEQISNYLSDVVTATDAAYKAVTEVDMAREMTSYVANNIQSQAAQAMVAQSNQSLAQVLNLLQV